MQLFTYSENSMKIIVNANFDEVTANQDLKVFVK